MAGEEEWERAKAGTAEQRSTPMQFNQYPAEGGGGGESGLTVHDDELGALGNMAHDLCGGLSTAADRPRPATFRLGGESRP